MFASPNGSRVTVAALAAVVVLLGGVGAARGQQLFYEDFEDETLATNAAIQNATISGGKAAFDDAVANRATYSVVQNLSDVAAMTFSFDIVAPIVRGEPASFELVLRAGVGTAQNTLQNADQVVEAIVFRDGNRGAYVNNGMETIFLVANNSAANTLAFDSPIDGLPVTLNPLQYIPYVQNHETNSWGQIKGISNFNGGQRAFERFAIGSSSTGHVGTFSLDNVLVMQGATFERELVSVTPGDVDGDLDVDLDDFALIQGHFQQSVTMRSEGDLNNDGKVDFRDFRQWKTFYVPPPETGAGSGVPEPAGAALAMGLIGAVGALRRRTRRRWPAMA